MPKSEQLAIKVSDVSKHFKLPHDQQSSIKGKLINFHKRGYEKQEVLKNISFEVKQGEFLGIVGRNGSGKSTLLKILAGIYKQDSGNVEINGKLTPFIELGVGFNHELSGRDNVFLNGALLGFSRSEMEAMYDDIVAFAELERFMDQKLKNYSSGMQVRLAFSIAIRANTDILVLDEVLAVGDEAFQRKCSEFFAKIKKDKSKTVILVTHDMGSVKKYCDRAILIENGSIKVAGLPEDVANEYSLDNLSSGSADGGENSNRVNGKVSDYEVSLVSSKQLTQKDELKIQVQYRTTEATESYVAVVLMDVDRNVPLLITNSPFKKSKGEELVTFANSLDLSAFSDVNFRIISNIRKRSDRSMLAYYPEYLSPIVQFKRTDYKDDHDRTVGGITYNPGGWSDGQG